MRFIVAIWLLISLLLLLAVPVSAGGGGVYPVVDQPGSAVRHRPVVPLWAGGE
jgi:hypothetical protein